MSDVDTAALPSRLEQILADLRPAAERLAVQRRRRRRSRRSFLVVVVAPVVLASAAVGAYSIIGGPAPESVKHDLRAVDRGLPADLRLNPDVERAHAVAASDGSVVYFARTRDGGYCSEMVTAQGPRGAVCSTAAQAAAEPLSVTVPFTDPVTSSSPISLSGRVASPDARSVELVYPDGGSDSVRVMDDGFYAADVAEEHLAAVHARGLLLVARDGNGKPLAQAVLPNNALTPPSEAERPKDPIEIDMISDSSDFTLLLGVRGEVTVPGATRLELRYPDGTTADVPLKDGRFDFRIPESRRHSFMTPGELAALDRSGKALARRPLAAVAYWRARERGATP